MTRIWRRTLGTIVVSLVPVLAIVALSARAEVIVGTTTYSYRDLFRVQGEDNVDDIVRALKASGVTHVELAAVNVEPAGPTTGPAAPPRPAAYPVQTVVLNPEQAAAMKAAVRGHLRQWRISSPDGWFTRIREGFYAEGLVITAYAVEFANDFSDAEIDAVFRHARLVGAPLLSSPMTLELAARVAPFAVKHGTKVAIHTQPEGNAAGYISTANLDAALAISPALMLKLDIGHATASNRDAVVVLRQYLARVAAVNVQDRLRNGGRSEHLGDGDTPIAGVMAVLAGASTRVPALVEYSYSGLGASASEVRESVSFIKQALK